jgi:hypothetical protein
VRRACQYLDEVHEAHAEIAAERRERDKGYRRAEARATEAEDLPEIVPVKKALRFITSQDRTERAESNFKTFVHCCPDYFAGLRGAPDNPDALLRKWRKDGSIPLRATMELRAKYQQEWPRVKGRPGVGKQRKRGPRLNEKDKPVIREVVRAKRQAED